MRYSKHKRGLTEPGDILDFIRSRTRKSPKTGCWIWQGAIHGKLGYALCRRGGERLVHRLSWRAARGMIPFPADLEVDHLCRTRACVNPEHMEAVTHAENMRRSREAGHADGRYGARPVKHGTLYGYASRGCRCDECRGAAREYERRRHAERRQAMAEMRLRGVTNENVVAGTVFPGCTHGAISTYNQGCRCDLCLAERTRYNKQRRAAALAAAGAPAGSLAGRSGASLVEDSGASEQVVARP